MNKMNYKQRTLPVKVIIDTMVKVVFWNTFESCMLSIALATLLEFSRRFCAWSIAAGAPTNTNSVPVAMYTTFALDMFFYCYDEKEAGFNDNRRRIFNECLFNLNSGEINTKQHISSISCLCYAIYDCLTYRKINGLREISLPVANSISGSFGHFSNNAAVDVREYNLQNRNDTMLEIEQRIGRVALVNHRQTLTYFFPN